MLLEILWGPRNMVFKIKASSPLKVLMDAFCARASVESSAVVFLDYRYGSQVQPTDSAYDLGFISGSKIVVIPNVPYTLFYDPGPATAPCRSKTASTTPPTASALSSTRSGGAPQRSPRGGVASKRLSPREFLATGASLRAEFAISSVFSRL